VQYIISSGGVICSVSEDGSVIRWIWSQ